MLTLAPISLLGIFWTAVAASPVLVQNATHPTFLEQRGALEYKLFLGKQRVGTNRERWGIFFGETGVGFASPVVGAEPSEKSTMTRIAQHIHQCWEMSSLTTKVKFDKQLDRDELYKWIEHDMITKISEENSHLWQSTTKPDRLQDTPFGSGTQLVREIFYGGPELDPQNPQAPPKRRRTGGSSLDMAWVILEELGKRKLYSRNGQVVPKVFQDNFNEHYIKIWRKRWEDSDAGKHYAYWMLHAYPASKYPLQYSGWIRRWTL
ncbi:hypothetical protein D9757_008244 [Collybiopsis confluens]|uniref:LAGLIDADG homing endonuclease n=1 Tax=Collybiopsis confluens TaxID=2823264 RepID=A0A8H5HBN4_9AGAR|nr:hypothetical protein D9757_008244 [Collybiopsis confluens]